MKSNIHTFKHYVQNSLLPIIAMGIMLLNANIVKAQATEKTHKQKTDTTIQPLALDSTLWVNESLGKPSVPLDEFPDLLLDDPLTNLDIPNTLTEPIRDVSDTDPEPIIYDNNHSWLDRMATYKYGKRTFIKSIIYPQEAINKGIEGLVKVFFVVEPDGSTSHIKILKSLNYECDQAVIDAVQNAKFNPGVVDGRTVRVHCVLPVYFGLNNIPS